MKIKLPNGERITLDNNIPISDKIKLVEGLTEEWKRVILENWNSESIKFFLDNLANYCVWHKEDCEKRKQDKDVFSIKRIEQLEGKRKSPSIPFSCVSKEEKERLGIDDGDDIGL